VTATAFATVLGDRHGPLVSNRRTRPRRACAAWHRQRPPIEIDGPEVPIMDGSGLLSLPAIDQAGILTSPARAVSSRY